MNDTNDPHFDPEPIPGLPVDLVAALKRHDARPLPQVAEMDRALNAAARQHFGRGVGTSGRVGRWRGWAAAGAAAAVLTLVVVVWPGGGPVVAHDFNGDGRLDVLDALRLAQQLATPPEGADVNGDGQVNQMDVKALCHGLVRRPQSEVPA